MGLRLNGLNSGYVEVVAPPTASNNNFVLPEGTGVNGQFLQSTGTGTTWAAVSGGGTGSGLFNTGITSLTAVLVSNLMTTVYTAPATSGTYIVHSIYVTNIDGLNDVTISGQMYAGNIPLATQIPVPAGTSVELLKQPKVLSANDIIRFQCSANNSAYVTIIVEPKTGDSTYIGTGAIATAASTYYDLWTATGNATLQSILLVNTDGVFDTKARVVYTDASNNIITYYSYGMTIPADSSVELLEKPKYMISGSKIRIYADQANRLSALLSAKTQ